MWRRPDEMVRPAVTSDRDAVGALWSALMDSQAAIDDRFSASDDARERWDNDFPQWLQSESRKMYVAVEDDTVCGFATVERWGPPPIYRERPGLYVDEIFVDPAYRRRGYGRSLVDAVRNWGREIGAREVRAGVFSPNEEAGAFWKKVGGTEIAKTFALVLDASRDDAARPDSRLGFQM